MLEIPSTLFVRGRFKLKSQANHENLKKTCFIVFFFNLWLYSLLLYDYLIMAVKVKHNFEKVGPTLWIAFHRKINKSVLDLVYF